MPSSYSSYDTSGGGGGGGGELRFDLEGRWDEKWKWEEERIMIQRRSRDLRGGFEGCGGEAGGEEEYVYRGWILNSGGEDSKLEVGVS